MHKILVLVTCAKMPLINAHADISSKSKVQNFVHFPRLECLIDCFVGMKNAHFLSTPAILVLLANCQTDCEDYDEPAWVKVQNFQNPFRNFRNSNL